ncbi:sensor domain-containing diguanylate cyclase [Roseovarius nitratireducens]|uniref:sensor domain-containing diguanylate cyclase n=1 Tax=Roseovarius nitratireducens TaxID=2044597 RepID=UPI000CE2347A|nr:sensor domain-containing diguanylate cyclase [Roseovarius nitratireducens]
MTLQPTKLDDEAGRIAALRQMDALTYSSEASFKHITGLLQLILDMEMVSINFITEEKQILKARQGIDVTEMPRDVAFCNIAIRTYDLLIIEDTHDDARVRDNPLVTGPPFLRSYIGAPLTTADGYNLGMICAVGTKPRHFTAREVRMTTKCAKLTMNQLELRSQASHDFLTELSNRRSFVSGLENEMARLRRSKGTASVAFLDIDLFKQVNDTFGHPAGDRVLREFADVIVGQSRQHDLVARLGGEEFAVLLPDTDLDAARIWAERVREQVAETRFDGDNALRLTVSVGLASVDETQTTSDAIMLMADTALYEAKQLGRNRVTVL